MHSQESAEFLRLMSELCANTRPIRYGWARSVIDEQQRDYILARESVINAIANLRNVSWQSIDAENQVLAEKIHAQAVHSLTVLAHAMRKNERNLLG